jgi:hypothetical protein
MNHIILYCVNLVPILKSIRTFANAKYSLIERIDVCFKIRSVISIQILYYTFIGVPKLRIIHDMQYLKKITINKFLI